MAKKYITQERLKQNTLADIFIFILEKQQTTRREIQHETGFSWGTVSANVSLLLEKGYLKEKKSGASVGAGRTTYILSPANSFVGIGLDINRSGLSCTVVTPNAAVAETFETAFAADTQEDLLHQAEALCRQAVDWCAENGLRVFSLGIAMQGEVDGRQGLSLRFPGIADWQVCNIKEHFARAFALPVYLGHDPKCMLLGALYREKCDNCVLVRIDDGIGMAVALDGRILDDTKRLELGHTLSVPNGRPCRCGKRGCLEVHGSLSAVARDTGGSDAILRAPDTFATKLCEAGKVLAVALYNMVTLFQPERLILTGKATALSAFTENALSLLQDEAVAITVDPEISAAYGAAVESMKSAIKAFHI